MLHTLPLSVSGFPNSIDEALQLAVDLGKRGTVPGEGATAELWHLLTEIGALDLGAVRAIEPHLDAIAIIEQSGNARVINAALDADRTWGVFASEGGPDPLIATYTEDDVPRWTITGTKQWCSLAGSIDAALVTAQTTEGERGLFAVELSDVGVRVEPGAWHARGLTEIPSGPVHFSDVLALPIGEPGWYLKRPGFSWGGIGVAACWLGGAVGVARTVFAAAQRPDPNPFLLMHLGAIDATLHSAKRAIEDAAALVDAGLAEGAQGRLLTKRVRAVVAAAVDDVLARAAHALGPAPLALDAEHAKRVADLQLYVRQHHAEKDLASLGTALLESEDAPW
ncbi:acyl-CoA dehydrogenase [Glaciihabitans arcticus]|uniref:Acyl-CoA dehydrogenase n=1 Tax=Glaciihabitans arcticus TaxID=2668039 RepID=A0A4V2JEU4_9MICO|nr:acyl-CoA dehydrogenase family protein [Glaciihabitans arcticus]TBN56909.1 acyl-CoA dehydrogenase [Glaciihabitans arcticus]